MQNASVFSEEQVELAIFWIPPDIQVKIFIILAA